MSDALKFLQLLADNSASDDSKSSSELFEAKRVANGDMHISGYAAVFGNIDHSREVIERGAFKHSLSEHRANRTMPYMFLQHDKPGGVIGLWEHVQEDGHGLLVKGRIFHGVRRGADAIALIEGSALDGLSVGYNTVRDQMVDRVRHIKQASLVECSFVHRPANPMARIHKMEGTKRAVDGDVPFLRPALSYEYD